VTTWDMAARKVYCCEGCQPRLAGTELPTAALDRVARTAKHHVGGAGPCTVHTGPAITNSFSPIYLARRKIFILTILESLIPTHHGAGGLRQPRRIPSPLSYSDQPLRCVLCVALKVLALEA